MSVERLPLPQEKRLTAMVPEGTSTVMLFFRRDGQDMGAILETTGEGIIPMERRVIARLLRGMADEMDEQAEGLERGGA